MAAALAACGGAGSEKSAPVGDAVATPAPAPVPAVQPVVVGNCSGLGAKDQWQPITPPGVDLGRGMGVLSVATSPVNSGTLLAGTDGQGLWLSTDCGATWTKRNTGRGGDKLDSGSLWVVRYDPTDANVVYAGSLYGSDIGLLKSTNGGVDWVSAFANNAAVAYAAPNPFFQDIGIDPTQHLHVVVTIHDNCAHEFAPVCLLESFDGGGSWRALKGPPQLRGWAERAGVIVIGEKEFIFHTWMDGIFHTADAGNTWLPLGIDGYFTPYPARDGYTYLPSIRGMHRTKNWLDWSAVDGAPSGDAIAGDGMRMFTAWDDFNPKLAYAYESDSSRWTAMALPTANPKRISGLVYDPGHKLLYMSATGSGLWRMVTQ